MKLLCEFERLGDRNWQCARCGQTVDTKLAPRANCKGSPSALDQARSLAQAAYQVAKDPTPASPEEVERRLAICHGCRLYSDNILHSPYQGRCTACGCAVHLKASRKTLGCPRGYW